MVDLFAAMSSAAPVLLLLDDLHWADTLSLLLLRHLLRSNEPMRLLVIGTYRDTDIGRNHPLTQLLPDLRRERRGLRLALSRLVEDDVAAMVAAAADRELDADEVEFARYLHAETDGHPFCVEEVLLHFVESGSLRTAGRWVLASAQPKLTIPEGVREVVLQRVTRLPETVHEVLAAAAVIGQQFDVSLLAEMVDGGMQVVLEALEAAERARLIGPVPGRANRYQFAHALIRSSLYEDMPTSRRRWLHRDVGRALERLVGIEERLTELAIHFGEAAAVGEADRAVAYARQGRRPGGGPDGVRAGRSQLRAGKRGAGAVQPRRSGAGLRPAASPGGGAFAHRRGGVPAGRVRYGRRRTSARRHHAAH